MTYKECLNNCCNLIMPNEGNINIHIYVYEEMFAVSVYRFRTTPSDENSGWGNFSFSVRDKDLDSIYNLLIKKIEEITSC